jgi:hypothetical protein
MSLIAELKRRKVFRSVRPAWLPPGSPSGPLRTVFRRSTRRHGQCRHVAPGDYAGD